MDNHNDDNNDDNGHDDSEKNGKEDANNSGNISMIRNGSWHAPKAAFLVVTALGLLLLSLLAMCASDDLLVVGATTSIATKLTRMSASATQEVVLSSTSCSSKTGARSTPSASRSSATARSSTTHDKHGGDDEPKHCSLGDPPIQGDAILHLDNNPQFTQAATFGGATNQQHQWTLGDDSGRFQNIPAMVPGDILTDLVRAGLCEEPYVDNQFQNASFCAASFPEKQPKPKRWECKVQFDIPPPAAAAAAQASNNNNNDDDDEMQLVLDGIKMGADVYVNDVKIGQTTDQFLRHAFPLQELGALLLPSQNNNNALKIQFDASMLTAGRHMACAGGWDWAPFSQCPLTQDTNSMTCTSGIFKSVYLVRVSTAAIAAVAPQTYCRGRYPVDALIDGAHDGFHVQVRVHLWAPTTTKPTPTTGRLEAQGLWNLDEGGKMVSQIVTWKGGETNVTLDLHARAKDILLWWPTGMGPNATWELSKRPLCDIQVRFIPLQKDNDNKEGPVAAQDTRRIGFRQFALVTGNDADPVYVNNAMEQQGTQFHGLFFRVNGVPIWSRGANVIPMDELEGRLHAQAHVQVAQSAVLGKMNTLRVWGGGMFLPQAWHQACDDCGILVIHDQMHAQEGHFPAETMAQELEIRHNIRVLTRHPSIVIWDGCNECIVRMDQPTSMCATFVMRLVAEEDTSRSIWPSCPAAG